MISRRAAIGLIAVLPLAAIPAERRKPMAGSAWTNQIVALIVVSAAQEGFAGVFEYSPDVAAGNLILSMAPAAGTDPEGDAYEPGFVSYSGGGYAQLFGAKLNLLAPSGTTPASLAADPGELIISSGQKTGGFDPQSQILMFDEQASGSPNGIIELLAGNLKIGTASTQPVPFPSAGITTVAQVVAALIEVGIFE
jgi:hypothetical protein